MACTTLPISPESRKPLHTQVQNLREERINLLETVRALREDKDNLRVQLAAASRRISELDAKVDDGDMKRASLQDECNAIRQTSQMHETIASQLRGEATAWQARLTHTESEHSRRTLAHERDFKQAEDKWAQERYQMMSELLAAQAEKRSAEENWRMLAAESSRSKQLLEAQRDDAMHRCGAVAGAGDAGEGSPDGAAVAHGEPGQRGALRPRASARRGREASCRSHSTRRGRSEIRGDSEGRGGDASS